MKFWADENFRGDILRGLLGIYPELDIIRIQDTELMGVDDIRLLAEAANAGAILLTHDVNTITHYVNERLRAGLPMVGVIAVHQDTSIKTALEDLSLLIGASTPDEFENRVRFIPLH